MENWNDVHITVYIYTHNQHGITINYFHGIQYSDMAKWENDEAWHQTFQNFQEENIGVTNSTPFR